MSIGNFFKSPPVIKNDQPQVLNETLKKMYLSHKIAYHTSLLYTLANRHINQNNQQWWNRIKGTSIILGAIPLKNRNHHLRIFKETIYPEKNQKQLAVLTLLKPYEIFSKGLFSVPVTPDDWKQLGVVHKIIPASDFDPLSQEQIHEAVSFLEEQDAKGNPSYVHCKAGRGRSATASICFLMKKYFLTAEKAKEIVAESRSQINLNSRQWKAIKAYELSLNR